MFRISDILGPDPDIRLTDPDPAIFVSDLQDSNKTIFFLLITFKGTFTLFSKIKSKKEKSQNSMNQGFSYYFYLMIEGSEPGPLSNGSRFREAPRILNTNNSPVRKVGNPLKTLVSLKQVYNE